MTSLAREPYTSLHSSSASGMLDGPVAKAEPSQWAAEHASGSAQEGPKGSVGALPAETPKIPTAVCCTTWPSLGCMAGFGGGFWVMNLHQVVPGGPF